MRHSKHFLYLLIYVPHCLILLVSCYGQAALSPGIAGDVALWFVIGLYCEQTTGYDTIVCI